MDNSLEKLERLFFVCTGNTCRSPMAKVLYQSMAPDTSLYITSRGLVVLFPESANPKAVMVAGNHNLDLSSHVAKPLRDQEINDGTLLLTMTEEQKIRVKKHFPAAVHIATLKEFVNEMGDVADPYGGTLVEYEECFGELARLVKKVVFKLAARNETE